MLLNNINDGKEYQYFDIQFVNNKWIVWFNREIEISDALLPPVASGVTVDAG